MNRIALLWNVFSQFRKSSFKSIDFQDILRLNKLKRRITLRLIANLDQEEDLRPYIGELRRANINSIAIFQHIKKEVTKRVQVIERLTQDNFDAAIKQFNEEIRRTLTCLIDQEDVLLKMKTLAKIKKDINKYHELLSLETELVSINETLAKAIVKKYYEVYGRDKIEKFCHELAEKGEIERYWIRGFDKIDFLLVLGRSLYGKIIPKPMFDMELKVAAQLYKEELTQKIVVTGMSPEWEYMVESLTHNGVKKRDIIVESSAKNTVANFLLVRVKGDIPNGSNVVIITMGFHLYRAKALCEKIFGRFFKLGYIGTSAMAQDNLEFLLKNPQYLLDPNPLSLDKYKEIEYLLQQRGNFDDVTDGDILALANKLNLFGSYANDPQAVAELINYIREKLEEEGKRK